MEYYYVDKTKRVLITKDGDVLQSLTEIAEELNYYRGISEELEAVAKKYQSAIETQQGT